MTRKSFEEEARSLFERFATKHALDYQVDTEAPIEVLWYFPVQPKLSHSVTLGLQNCDELNFGVDDFWSYMFPFSEVEEQFWMILDAWVDGRARIAKTWLRGRKLELWDGSSWQGDIRGWHHLTVLFEAIRLRDELGP